jgi:hypothetical protein
MKFFSPEHRGNPSIGVPHSSLQIQVLTQENIYKLITSKLELILNATAVTVNIKAPVIKELRT